MLPAPDTLIAGAKAPSQRVASVIPWVPPQLLTLTQSDKVSLLDQPPVFHSRASDMWVMHLLWAG